MFKNKIHKEPFFIDKLKFDNKCNYLIHWSIEFPDYAVTADYPNIGFGLNGAIILLKSYTNLGKNKSKVRGKRFSVRGDISTGSFCGKGYRSIRTLMRLENRESSNLKIHRGTCNAYYGRCDILRQYVNHKDGIKYNNRPSNLEWSSQSENLLHGYTLESSKHRLIPILVKYLKDSELSIRKFTSIARASESLDIPYGTLLHIFNSKSINTFLDKYQFKADNGSVWPSPCLSSKHHAKLYVFDLNTDNVKFFDTYLAAAIYMGISRSATHRVIHDYGIGMKDNFIFKLEDGEVLPSLNELYIVKAGYRRGCKNK